MTIEVLSIVSAGQLIVMLLLFMKLNAVKAGFEMRVFSLANEISYVRERESKDSENNREIIGGLYEYIMKDEGK